MTASNTIVGSYYCGCLGPAEFETIVRCFSFSLQSLPFKSKLVKGLSPGDSIMVKGQISGSPERYEKKTTIRNTAGIS